MKNEELLTLLQTLVQHWQSSAAAYKNYMENGKQFRYAELLKVHNSAVNNLLKENISAIPQNHREDAEALIEHYTIWSGKWDELKKSLDPGPDDEFVFQNDNRFPRQAAQNFEATLSDLSNH